MTDFAGLLVPDRGQTARPIHLVDKGSFDAWAAKRPASDRALMKAHRFDGKTGFAFAILPRGEELEVVSSVADAESLSPWCLAKLAASLPDGTYRLASGEPAPAELGWLLAQHRNDTYRRKSDTPDRGPRVLVTSAAARIEEAVRIAAATALVRDLVDTPAADMGPAELEAATATLAKAIGGDFSVTSGKELDDGFPLIAAVGRAATKERAPRLIEMVWGNPNHPRLAIVGKGVCFDTGGLDIKGASGMRLMKKDMGGAAHALALARLVAETRLPVRLHLLIPAAENSVSGSAYRPGDVIRSRLGLQVEIDNTDAEGRLILADALAKAVEAEPERIIDFATRTGAARVALGPDLPAFFANDDGLARAMLDAASDVDDPIWRMPLWAPYDEMLKSDLADLANSSNSPMAGCITAAMFLKRFVPDTVAWGHFDTYAWRESAKPGRPKGGDALGLRAAFAALKTLYPPR
jgi:leucyl aminopeptidase